MSCSLNPADPSHKHTHAPPLTATTQALVLRGQSISPQQLGHICSPDQLDKPERLGPVPPSLNTRQPRLNAALDCASRAVALLRGQHSDPDGNYRVKYLTLLKPSEQGRSRFKAATRPSVPAHFCQAAALSGELANLVKRRRPCFRVSRKSQGLMERLLSWLLRCSSVTPPPPTHPPLGLKSSP